MKTARDLELKGLYWNIFVPAGAAVVEVTSKGKPDQKGPGRSHGFALRSPEKYGVNSHDAKYRYVWIPADAVIP